MKIVVNHLTRMQPGYICVAGIDPSNGNHVRPVLEYGRLTTKLLTREGGPFGIGAIVDLGGVTASGYAPEVEDYVFDPASAKGTSVLSPTKFWKMLASVSQSSLGAIFGNDLKPNGKGMAVDVGSGKASLGCLLPRARPSIEVDSYRKVKVRITEGDGDLYLSMTDLRLYEQDQKTPRRKLVADLDRRIQAGTKVILAVGLARAWKKPGDSEERHFLQVNNLHLEDDPCWSQ